MDRGCLWSPVSRSSQPDTDISQSDVHIWKGEIRTTFPSALGHEGAGIVKAVGSSVTDVKPGDRVALEPVSKPRFQSGMVSRFFIIPAAHCYKLADNVTMEEGWLLSFNRLAYNLTAPCLSSGIRRTLRGRTARSRPRKRRNRIPSPGPRRRSHRLKRDPRF